MVLNAHRCLQMGFALQQNGFYSCCLQGWPQAAPHPKAFKRKTTYNCRKQLSKDDFRSDFSLNLQLLSAQVCPDIHPSLPPWEFTNPPSLHPLLSLPQPHMPSDLHDGPACLSLLRLSMSLLHDTKEVT